MSFNSPLDDSNFKPNSPAANNEFISPSLAYGSSAEVQPTNRTSAFSIVGLILAILLPLIGMILSIVAFRQAAETGDNKGLAKAGIIVGAVLTLLNVIFTIFFFGALGDATVNGTLTSS